MKLLIIEENEQDRKAAEVLLGKDNDLTIVSNLKDAKRLLRVNLNKDLHTQLLEESGIAETCPLEKAARQTWWDKKDEIEEKSLVRPVFDAVLVGLMMRASHLESKQAMGLNIAFNAIHAGIRKVAVVCGNADEFPDTETLQMWSGAHFNGDDWHTPMQIGKAQVLFCGLKTKFNPQTWQEVLPPSTLPHEKMMKMGEARYHAKRSDGWEKFDNPDLITAKAWHCVLNRLFSKDRIAKICRE